MEINGAVKVGTLIMFSYNIIIPKLQFLIPILQFLNHLTQGEDACSTIDEWDIKGNISTGEPELFHHKGHSSLKCDTAQWCYKNQPKSMSVLHKLLSARVIQISHY